LGFAFWVVINVFLVTGSGQGAGLASGRGYLGRFFELVLFVGF